METHYDKIRHSFELISKITAAALIAVYICGFLIVSLHNSSYGFSGISPLKPKILTAGTLFLFFTLLPIIPLQRIFRNKADWDVGVKKVAACSLAFLKYFLVCFLMSWLLSELYVANQFSLDVWDWQDPDLFMPVAAMCLIVIAAIMMTFGFNNQKSPIILTLVTGLALVASLTSAFFWMDKAVEVIVLLWFFAIGAIWFYIETLINNPGKSEDTQWEQFILPILLAGLIVFSNMIYPKIYSSWGGGKPVPVIVYMSKDSPIYSNQKFSAMLLDESNDGIFVIPKNEKKALYLPRATTRAIYFSEQPLVIK